MFQPSLLESAPVQIARDNAEKFPDDFLSWLPDNIHIFEAFTEEALTVIRRGYKHYSAYTIVEFLRHHTAIKENSSDGLKINNNHRPYLGRLFDHTYPQHAGIFERRVTKKVYTSLDC